MLYQHVLITPKNANMGSVIVCKDSHTFITDYNWECMVLWCQYLIFLLILEKSSGGVVESTVPFNEV